MVALEGAHVRNQLEVGGCDLAPKECVFLLIMDKGNSLEDIAGPKV